jgi:hypothetical protein
VALAVIAVSEEGIVPPRTSFVNWRMLEKGTRMRQALYGAGLLIVLGAVAGSVQATVVGPVPEIDSSSITAGLGLLAGAVMIVRARTRRK